AVLRPGDHLLSSEWIYGGVYRLFAQEFGRFGIEVSFVNPLEQRTWKRGLKKNTRAIFVETPTNPLIRVLDLEPIAALCKTEGLALVVDSTFATPLNYRPLEHGADVVIHSATKYLNGHSDVLAGMLGVELKGGARAAERFLRALTIATHAPSLGGVETLVSEPRLTSHAGLTPDARARAGIADGFLRFSIGLEDSDDIIADFA